ncbi:hypothetical protein DPMN_084614 [Dreissena polymorpha]|uniref:Uncharacterized protein n=1 Tax=Dreissena polymorpha TaxID=45954 RepID=A0A9D3YEV9_DREPO|nr:hypothetical protein DPMN_084614 [Dreissena polymorpha]
MHLDTNGQVLPEVCDTFINLQLPKTALPPQQTLSTKQHHLELNREDIETNNCIKIVTSSVNKQIAPPLAIVTNVLTKFHEHWTKNVLIEKNAPLLMAIWLSNYDF